MSDNKETDSRKSLSNDDIDLWKEMTRDVERLKGREYIEVSHEEKPEKKRADSFVASEEKSDKRALPVQSDRSRSQDKNLDRNTQKRLRRGEMPIEGKLDLHGMNQGQARQALINFIVNAQSAGKRCVLVVTGKGNTGRTSDNWLDSKPGVLKQKVPDWLGEAELNNIVLQAVSALPKHGGDGALYVYLRRLRD